MANLDRNVMYNESDKTSKEQAIRYAMRNNIAHIRNEEGEVTVVPSPQRSGTMAQQQAYENITVRRFLQEPAKVLITKDEENPCLGFSIDCGYIIEGQPKYRVVRVYGNQIRKDSFSFIDIDFGRERKELLEKIFPHSTFLLIVD